MTHKNWEGFTGGAWQEKIDVRDFIQKNYCEYKGDDSFLSTATTVSYTHLIFIFS